MVFGQGRPLGKCWRWLQLAKSLPQGHSPSDHPSRGWKPTFAERREARIEALLQDGIQQWVAAERDASPTKDGIDNEPHDLP